MKRKYYEQMTVKEIKDLVGKVEWKCTKTATKTYNCALVPCSFDIETTNEFMYIWTLSIYDHTYFGYTIFDLTVALGIINKAINLGCVKDKATKVLPIFVHNFGNFEWHFLKEELKITDKFLKGSEWKIDTKTKKKIHVDVPALFAVAYSRFMFVDSFSICPNMSLDDLAKTYCKTQKMVGDLDYSKERNTEDAKHLTEEEMTYCCNDTLILTEFAQYVFDNYFKKYDKLPLSQNQIVGSAVTKAFEEERLSIKDKKSLEKLKKFYDDEFLDQPTYRFVRAFGFRGGYCASSGQYWRCVGYGDLDAAYTAAIVHGYYPRGRYTKIKDPSLWKTFINTKCCQLKIRFTNLKAIEPSFLYESRHNVFTKDKVECDESGKVMKVYGNILVSLNEIHLKLYKKFYTWDKMEVLELKIADRGMLPMPVIKAVLSFYLDKAKLKKAGLEDTPEYKRIKTLPSTVFGAMSKRIKDIDLEELSANDWYTKYHGLKLKPQWGTYITAHVRNVIVNMIFAIGVENWLYTDTDSIYYKLSQETKKCFDEFNEKMRTKNKQFCEKYGFDYSLLDDLGTFDDKSRHNFKIDEFITTGAKSYAYHYTDDKHPDGDYKIVMAGIPNEAIVKAWKDSGLSFVEFFNSPYQVIEFTRKTSEIVHNTSRIVNGMKMTCKCGVRIKEEPVKGTIRGIKNRLAFETWQDNVNDDLSYNGD